VEIIEREIECNKKLEEAQEQLVALSQCEQKCNELIQTLEEERSKSTLLEDRNCLLIDRLSELEEEINRLEGLCSSKTGEITKIVAKMNSL
jgi:cell division protein FtsB